MPHRVIVWGTGNVGVPALRIVLSNPALEPQRRGEMMQKSGRRTVPQIWIGERHVGGCDDLYALEREGRLDPLLEGSP